MIKKLLAVLLAACLMLAGFSPVGIQAQSGIVVTDNSVYISFPVSMSFSLDIESDYEITEVRLHYTTERKSYAYVENDVAVTVPSKSSVEIQYLLDMHNFSGLPPGTLLYYWWTVEDAGGNSLTTETKTVIFNDTRYSWQSITQGSITLYWYTGSNEFAGELMNAAQAALVMLAEDAGSYLTEHVDIYIYASFEEVRGAMLYATEWTGGVAFTKYNAIIIGISTDNLEWGKNAMAHELAHVVTYQMTVNPYGGIPTWLNEGISMYAEGELSLVFQAYLDNAISRNALFTVRTLASPFSADSAKSYLSYAQSYSFVSFLIEEYGRDKLSALLDIFSEGSGYDEALLAVYGFDMDGLDVLWRDWVGAEPYPEPGPDIPVTGNTGSQFNAAVILLLALVIGGVFITALWLWRGIKNG